MIPTLDFILIILFILLISIFIYLLTEINIIESGAFGVIFMFLYIQKFPTLAMIPLSPILALLFSALVFSLSGAVVVGVIRKIA